MIHVLPKRSFFRFELTVPRLERPPKADGNLRDWNAAHRIPPLIEIEGSEAIADAYWGWNEDFLAVAFEVPNRRGKPVCEPKHWWKKDGIRVCIDTRDARDVRRATRFCHLFYILPVGGGPARSDPVVGLHRMSRAKEPPATVDVSRIRLGVHVRADRYAVEAVFPAEVLSGWRPAEHPRIGFFYKVKDSQRGPQHLTATDDLGWNVDPSTWATAVLSH